MHLSGNGVYQALAVALTPGASLLSIAIETQRIELGYFSR
jgi:hypothetical protein